MKHAPHFEPTEAADVKELENWATKVRALDYIKDADPVAHYSADIQRLAILGNVGNQELTKLDAFRKGMPADSSGTASRGQTGASLRHSLSLS